MEDFIAYGISERTAGILVDLGITTYDALAAWADANPMGTEEIGRVAMSEIAHYLAIRPEDRA